MTRDNINKLKSQRTHASSDTDDPSEIRYRRLFETAPYGILILDSSSQKITEANPFMVELLGYGCEEIIGKELWEIGLFKNSTSGHKAFAELLERGSVRYDLPVLNRVGDRRQVEFVGHVSDEAGEKIVQCHLRDITHRKAADDAFQEIHRRLTFHVENTPLAVIEWDRDFRLSRWSPSAERLFGWKAEEVLGKRITDWRFVYEDDIDEVKKIRSRQQLGIEEHGVSKNRNYTKDGSVVHCEWYNSVLYDASGKLESILSLVLDVTTRNLAEEERAQLFIREQEARKEAEEANRSKDEFLATVSHELRTPLASILGWARLLGGDMVDRAKYPQVFETIARNAKSQAQLIDDLLDVSRIVTGKLRLDVRSLELKPIIESTIETVRPAAAAKEIELNVDLHPDVGAVSGDPDRLQQLVWNLLSNAIKFTPHHGRVDVTLTQDGSDVELVVRDTGQGIKAEFLPHVFERFRQADGSTARKYGGLGLGLAIVRHLTELHGGTVAVESEGEERGSTFRVTLPLLHRTDESLEQPVEHGGGSTNGLSALRPALDGVRILVVDDEADVREFAVMTFQECGAEAISASSLAEAMNIIGTWKPNVLIADIGMPDEDGYALIRRVRSLPAEQGGRIPAMALTAYARTEDRVRILSSGYQIHVAKPVEPVELITAVASLAGRTIPE